MIGNTGRGTMSALLLFLIALFLVACSSGGDCDSPDSNETCTSEGPVEGESVVSTQSDSGSTPAAETEPQNVDRGDGSLDNPSSSYTLRDINHIIVATGQSNVEAPDTAFDPSLDHPDPRVFVYTDSGWRVASLYQVWDDNAHPGNHALTDPNNTPNNNFVFHFGKSMTQIDPDAVVGFIVLAAPGKGIAHWDYETGFYWKMRNKIRNALGELPHRDSIDVMLWHQGESDAQYEGTSDPNATGFTDENSIEYKNYYAIKLKQVIDNFRSEAWGRWDLPFICGETRISFRVNRRLLELNDDDDPNTECVFTTDLPYRLSDPSGAHYSAAGLRELGRRYMEAYLGMINR